MALTDSDSRPLASFENACESASLHVPPSVSNAEPPIQSLARLHGEARRTIRATLFLARSPHAALVLMGAGTLVLAAGWGTLRADFAWSVLLLTGIVAMTRNFIRGFARSLCRLPLEQATANLRAILMLCGIAWGSGVFLVLPPAPSVLLASSFTLLPGLALALMLKDEKGIIAFTTPCALMAVGAAQIHIWPHAGLTTGMVLILGTAITLLPNWPRRA